MELDHHALLTIHNLPGMQKRTVKGLVKWLHKLADDFEKEKDLNIYAKRFRARYMK